MVPVATGLTLPSSYTLVRNRLTSFRHHWLAVILAAATFVSTGISSAEESPLLPMGDEVFKAPGPGATKVVAVLQAIIDGQARALEPLKDVYLKGRLSFVTEPWSEDDGSKGLRSLEPSWRSFSLVRRGNKRRFELVGSQDWAKGVAEGKVYRLCDSDAIYALNPHALEIQGMGNFEGRWSDLTYAFSAFLQVHDGKTFGTVAEVSQKHIERITNNDPAMNNRMLTCYREDGLLVVHLGPAEGKKLITDSKYWVDPARGYCLVKSELQQGGPGRGRYNVRHTSASYKEVIPGSPHPIRGTCQFLSLGTAAKKGGSAGWGHREIEVKEVKLDDFVYDDSNFSVDSLPIPVGATVTDHRYSPPLKFNYKKSPLNEQVLSHAANSAASLDE